MEENGSNWKRKQAGTGKGTRTQQWILLIGQIKQFLIYKKESVTPFGRCLSPSGSAKTIGSYRIYCFILFEKPGNV